MNRLIAMVGMTLVAVSGCGGSQTPAGPSIDDACSAQATASCAKRDSCRSNGVKVLYGTLDACVAAVKASCVANLGARGTGNTPTLLAACTTAIGGASCADWYTGNIDACQPKTGTLLLGASCVYSSQCATAFCSIATGSACGACAASPPVGAACASGGQCGRGQICTNFKDPNGAKTCQTASAANGPCFSNSDCAYGTQCAGANAAKMTPGACVAVGATAGTMCNRKSGPLCDTSAALYCSFAPAMDNGMCIPFLYATAGQPCGYTAGQGMSGSTYTVCASGSECILAVGMSAGTCAAPATVGQPCDTDPTKGPPCAQPARCVWSSAGGTAGTCKPADSSVCM